MQRFESYQQPIGMRPLLLALGLAALFSGGCQQAAEQPSAARAAPEGARSTATAAPQKSPRHTQEPTPAPHAHAAAEQQGIHLSAAARANLNLQTAEVAPRTIEQILKVPGGVKAHPDRLVHVTPRLEARIEKVYVNVGDAVRQGAPLLELRSVEVEKLQVELLRAVKSRGIVEQSYTRTKELTENTVLTELEKLQQELLQARSELQLAAAALARTQQLSDKVVARKDLLMAQTEHQKARGTYNAVQRKLHTYGITEAQLGAMLAGGGEQPVLVHLGLSPQAAVQKFLTLGNPGELFGLEAEYREKQVEVESLKRQLQVLGFSAGDIVTIIRRGVPNATFTLTAPIAGTVSMREATLGAVVEPAEKLFEIVDTSVMWVQGNMAENLLAAVHIGQTARARVISFPEEVFTGTVRAVGRTVDLEKRTIGLWVEVANPQGKLLPGMFADLIVVTQAATEALAVPLQAVITAGAEPFVFVENHDTYNKQNVVLGLKDDRYVEIRDGLFPGDRVVIQGGYELNSMGALAAQKAQGGDGHSGHAH